MSKQGKKAALEVKKILILAANPRDTDPLRLDQEVREIDEGLRRSKYRDRFELVQRWAVRIPDLRRVLLDEEPQIVHFCGHGLKGIKGSREKNRRDFQYEGADASEGGIVLEDEQGHSTVVGKAALAELVGILKEGIECVVLNACYSEVQAETLADHIPYVIGMRKAIGDEAAIEFSTGFYDGIGAGRTVTQAFALGCNAIHLKDLPEHLTPVIKQQPGAPEYLSMVAEKSATPAETEPPASVTSKVDQTAEVSGGDSYQAGGNITINTGGGGKPESTRSKIVAWLGIVTAATIITFVFDIPGKIRGAYSSSDANTVTVLVHGEKGKDQLVLPTRGIVKLIYGDAIISEQINNEGEATFKQVPETFFKPDANVEILFHDPEGEPYRAVYHDSLYQLTKGKYISLAVKLYGLDQISGIVKDFKTGNPLDSVRISIQGAETFSNQYGEYTLSIPPEKQKKYQSIRAFKDGYQLFELDSIPAQTGREIPILIKRREN